MKTSGNPSYKVVIVGESGVGKTTLMLSYIQDLIILDAKPTVGIQFASKNMVLSDGKQVTLHLWDTAGAEKYRSVVKNFYRGSSAVIIVYSITKKSSFQTIDYWYKEAKENSNKNTAIFVIGTHLDMEDSRQVSKEQLYEWMSGNIVDGVEELSCKNVPSLNRLFAGVAQKVYLDKQIRRSQLQKNQKIQAFDSISISGSQQAKENNKQQCCNV